MPKKQGYSTYRSNISLIIGQYDNATEERIQRAEEIYKEKWLELISTQPRGKVYKRTKAGGTHRASAPFEPPAVDFGLFRASFVSKVSRFKAKFTATIGAGVNVLYAAYLEYGTQLMAPRPLWRPVFEQTKNEIEALFKLTKR